MQVVIVVVSIIDGGKMFGSVSSDACLLFFYHVVCWLCLCVFLQSTAVTSTQHQRKG
jgi:hypothetical protein